MHHEALRQEHVEGRQHVCHLAHEMNARIQLTDGDSHLETDAEVGEHGVVEVERNVFAWVVGAALRESWVIVPAVLDDSRYEHCKTYRSDGALGRALRGEAFVELDEGLGSADDLFDFVAVLEDVDDAWQLVWVRDTGQALRLVQSNGGLEDADGVEIGGDEESGIECAGELHNLARVWLDHFVVEHEIVFTACSGVGDEEVGFGAWHARCAEENTTGEVEVARKCTTDSSDARQLSLDLLANIDGLVQIIVVLGADIVVADVLEEVEDGISGQANLRSKQANLFREPGPAIGRISARRKADLDG